MADGKFVAYYRVSTARQGASGLGLEAQRKAVEQYLDGGDGTLVEAFTEVETGKNGDRPELLKAIASAKRHKAVLVIAKLDRLARNVSFIANLLETGVEFVAVDNPQANKLMVHMLAAFAEHERDQISQRTKDALAAAKARGVQLGKHGKVIARRNRADADAFAQSLVPVIEDIRRQGFRTVRQIVDELNARDVPTAKGGRWHMTTVHRLLQRIDRLPDRRAA